MARKDQRARLFSADSRLELGRYSKSTALGCRCKAKVHGNPKVAGGLCQCLSANGHYRPTVALRIEGKKQEREGMKTLNTLGSAC